jgi:hypothetical protein
LARPEPTPAGPRQTHFLGQFLLATPKETELMDRRHPLKSAPLAAALADPKPQRVA